MLGIFKSKKRKIYEDNMRMINQRKSERQKKVYAAVRELNRPVTGRMVAAHLGWDSASVTNRLAELTKKGHLSIAYRKKGLDGVTRNFYEVKR